MNVICDPKLPFFCCRPRVRLCCGRPAMASSIAHPMVSVGYGIRNTKLTAYRFLCSRRLHTMATFIKHLMYRIIPASLSTFICIRGTPNTMMLTHDLAATVRRVRFGSYLHNGDARSRHRHLDKRHGAQLLQRASPNVASHDAVQ